MDFIIYPPSSRGQQPYSTELKQYQHRLESNVTSFKQHYTINRVVFKNQHAMSRIINLIQEFFGETPLATYENITVRLDILCGSMGIVHKRPRCETLPIIGDNDVMAYKKVSSVTWNGVKLFRPKEYRPLRLIDHNANALHGSYYLEPQSGIMGLWYIDLALLGAVYHQLLDEGLDSNQILTPLIYCQNIQSILDIATANNIESWVRDITVDDFSEYAPYQEHNLIEYGNRIKPNWVKYFSKFNRSSLADFADNGVWGNVTSPDKHSKINDYYVDYLMWVSAYVDMRYYKRLKSINDALVLDIPLKSVEKLPERLLTDNRISKLTAVLPTHSANIIDTTLRM